MTIYRGRTTAARANQLICAPVGGGHATLYYGLMRTPVIQAIGLRPLGKAKDDNRGYYAYDVLTLLRLVFRGDFYVSDETLFCRRDVRVTNSAVRRTDRIASLGLDRIPRLGRAIWNAHQYYADLRSVLSEGCFPPRLEDALMRSTIRQELRYYPPFARSLLRRRISRYVDDDGLQRGSRQTVVGVLAR